jgi:hypothetical protein
MPVNKGDRGNVHLLLKDLARQSLSRNGKFFTQFGFGTDKGFFKKQTCITSSYNSLSCMRMGDHFGIIITLVIGLIIFVAFQTNAALVAAKLGKTKGSRIADAQEGEKVKITGEIVYAGKTLKAPLSGRACVYYHVVVRERKRRRGFAVPCKIEEENIGDIVIKDGDDYAIISVNLKNLKSHVITDAHYSSGVFNDATEPLLAFIKKHHHRHKDFLGVNKYFTYEEGIVEAGELVTVVGKARWIERRETRLTIPASKMLVIGPSQQEPLYLTDNPGL